MIAPNAATGRRLLTGAAGVGLALVLAACGSNASDLASNASSTPPSSTATPTPTPSDTASATDSPPSPTDPTESSSAPAGDTINGQGYTYAIPDGWEDVSNEGSASQADSAVRVKDSGGGFGTNVNVIATPAQGVGDIESLRDTFAQQIQRLVDSKVQRIDDTTVDGEQAIGQTATKKQSGETLVFTQYFTAHNDTVYAVTLTAPQADAANGKQALDSILTSWSWT